MTQVLTRCINDEIRRNLRVIDASLANIKGACRGKIERQTHGKITYFYLSYKENGRRKRTCIGKADSEKVKSFVGDLARLERIRILENNNVVLEEVKSRLVEGSLKAIDARLPLPCRGVLREGFVDERMEELKRWAAEEYPRNSEEPQTLIHTACDGTRLRSKGEVIWYNILYALGIPFRYDCKILLTDERGRKVYKCPDFLIKCYDGSYLIIEHLGLLQDYDYCQKFANKTRLYQKAGFVLGDNYFVTSDDANGGTNAEVITAVAQQVEQRFYRC